MQSRKTKQICFNLNLNPELKSNIKYFHINRKRKQEDLKFSQIFKKAYVTELFF